MNIPIQPPASIIIEKTVLVKIFTIPLIIITNAIYNSDLPINFVYAFSSVYLAILKEHSQPVSPHRNKTDTSPKAIAVMNINTE